MSDYMCPYCNGKNNIQWARSYGSNMVKCGECKEIFDHSEVVFSTRFTQINKVEYEE